MAILSEYSWESDQWTHHGQPAVDTDDLASHQQWVDAVAVAGEKAHEALPTHRERITRALALVLDGHVNRLPGGLFQVRSQSKAGSKSYTVNGQCECPDSKRVSDGLCKHLLATMLWRKAKRLMQEQSSDTSTLEPAPLQEETAPTAEAQAPAPSIPEKHLAMIQGKAFIKYNGLLEIAHTRGLVSLNAEWTFNDAELSLAHAVATFADGRRFEESGDASKENCNKKVASSFRRVALTRAKARCLRDALGIDLVAVEELADSD